MAVKSEPNAPENGQSPVKKKLKSNNAALEESLQKCPFKLQGRDDESEAVATVYLFGDWKEAPEEEELIQKCMSFLDPKDAGAYSNCEDDEEYDKDAAEKALRKNGEIEDIYEFSGLKDAELLPCWTVKYEYNKTLTKEEASTELDNLFDGHYEYCPYPDGYDNFGVTPFGRSDGNDENPSELKKFYTTTLLPILDEATNVKHSFWFGQCENEECSTNIARNDFFLFQTKDDNKVLFKFDWEYNQC